MDKAVAGPAGFEPGDVRERYLLRNAIRWRMTGFDAIRRGANADELWEHGWTRDEKRQIEALMSNPIELKAVLLAWCRHDSTKPRRRNAWARQRIAEMLGRVFFQPASA